MLRGFSAAYCLFEAPCANTGQFVFQAEEEDRRRRRERAKPLWLGELRFVLPVSNAVPEVSFSFPIPWVCGEFASYLPDESLLTRRLLRRSNPP